MKPKCADWNLWIGNEIEGDYDIGHLTLFVREATMTEIEKAIANHDITRVWFCKEYIKNHMHSAGSLCGRHHKVKFVAEVTYDMLNIVTKRIRRNAVFYLKLPELVRLQNDDYICVGLPYEDEALRLGSGNRVKPEDYEEDIWLK